MSKSRGITRTDSRTVGARYTVHVDRPPKTVVVKPTGKRRHTYNVTKDEITRGGQLAWVGTRLGALALAAYVGNMNVPHVTLHSSTRVFSWSDTDGHVYVGNLRAFYEAVCEAEGVKPTKRGHHAVGNFITSHGHRVRGKQVRDGSNIGLGVAVIQKARRVRVK